MTTTKTKKFTFRLLKGRHQAGSGKDNLENYAAHIRGEPRLDKNGHPLPNVIETDLPLDAMFGREKFERIEK